jgi:predicted RNA binding protein YcfA (HicA-like mRNA interferase family)
MTALPIVSGNECILALQRVGYTITRTRGSHVRMNCPGRNPVTVRTRIILFVKLLLCIYWEV